MIRLSLDLVTKYLNLGFIELSMIALKTNNRRKYDRTLFAFIEKGYSSIRIASTSINKGRIGLDVEMIVTSKDDEVSLRDQCERIFEQEYFGSHGGLLAYCNRLFFLDKTKNFIPTKSLISCLVETKLKNVKCEDLKNYNAYFELDHVNIPFDESSIVENFSVSITDVENKTFLLVIIRNKDSSVGFFLFELKKGETVEMQIEKYNINETFIRKSLFNLILNLIVYSQNSNETLIESFNEFLGTKSKKEAQKKIYTQKSFIEMGRKFKELRINRNLEIIVSGHWRNQPYGCGRSLKKYIFIEPFTKNIK